MTLKINRVPNSRKDFVCTKFGQNPLKDVDSRVVTRMLRKDGRKEGRTDGSITISLRNFVGEGIIRSIKALYRVDSEKMQPSSKMLTNDSLNVILIPHNVLSDEGHQRSIGYS